jgi:hypothetical protein
VLQQKALCCLGTPDRAAEDSALMPFCNAPHQLIRSLQSLPTSVPALLEVPRRQGMHLAISQGADTSILYRAFVLTTGHMQEHDSHSYACSGHFVDSAVFAGRHDATIVYRQRSCFCNEAHPGS